MPGRLRPLRRADAMVALLVAVFDLFAASRLHYIVDTTVEPWHVLWPILFAASGLTSAWFAYCALHFRAHHMTAALSWSGALNITSYASRAMILLITSVNNTTSIQTEKLQLGVVVWLILAVLTEFIWMHVFKPGVEVSKHVLKPPPPEA